MELKRYAASSKESVALQDANLIVVVVGTAVSVSCAARLLRLLANAVVAWFAFEKALVKVRPVLPVPPSDIEDRLKLSRVE